MKRIICLLVIITIFATGCGNKSDVDSHVKAQDIEAIALEKLTSEFGYCDVSEYYQTNYFNSINGLVSCKIYTCNDSTNFDELGIFEFDSVKSAKKAIKDVKRYLGNAKEEFKSGIIYNVEEYPKFEAARVEAIGNSLVYTILSPNDSEVIFSSIAKK